MDAKLQWLITTIKPNGTSARWETMVVNGKPYAFDSEVEARNEAVKLSYANCRPFSVIQRRDYWIDRTPQWLVAQGVVYNFHEIAELEHD